MVIVANKTDLVEDPEEETIVGKKFATEIKAPHWQTSAKTSYNIEEMFRNIVELVDSSIKKNNRVTISLDPRKHQAKAIDPVLKKEKSKCC